MRDQFTKDELALELTGPETETISPALAVTARGDKAIEAVFKHFQLKDPRALVRALDAGEYRHEEPGRWIQCDVYLDTHALKPYRDLLERLTGYAGALPDMDLTAPCTSRLGYSHYVAECGIEDEMFHARVIDSLPRQDYGKTEDEQIVRAERLMEDAVQAAIGKRKFEREYIEMPNGLMRRNPDYLKRHAAEPGLGAPWLWRVIWEWWEANHATEAQRAILAAAASLRDGRLDPDWMIRPAGGDECHLVSFTIYVLDPNGPVNWDGKGTKARVVTWEDFKALGAEVSA